MTSKTLTSLLVGSHFVPPAKVLLAHLPAGVKLLLEPDPSNPYDENAIVVLIDPMEIPQSQYSALDNPHSGLPCQGATLEQLMSTGPVRLGHVASSGGKPLFKAKSTAPAGVVFAGNVEFLDWMKDDRYRAALAFGLAGEPLVQLAIDSPESQSIEGYNDPNA